MINELFSSPFFLLFIFLLMIGGFILFKYGEWIAKLKNRQHSIESPIVRSFEVAVEKGVFQGKYTDWLRMIGLEDKQAIEIYHKCSNIWCVKYKQVARIIKITEIAGLISCIVVVFSILFGVGHAFNIMSDVSIAELKKVNEIKLTYQSELNNEENSEEVKNIISNQLGYVEHAIASNDKITYVEYERIKDGYNAYRLRNFSIEYKKYTENKKSKNKEVGNDK